ncbi:bis-aminopropyl spermidine synthase family protein [Actinomadura opuntiae]|uniref:bis-aminopropyl spermidine synthase family protein n=1 Tax=Actinomadura sp. OS1-43 TaxID=604315 RepID=UPI00255ADB9B|nr:bis-aminopropyl spermidine synthase family protein [Actinomadura sp. OS1-43]MDL4814455.1 bis-aminopropyl spermidine synthase family protein [Actinomadura sp. OS1-43]
MTQDDSPRPAPDAVRDLRAGFGIDARRIDRIGHLLADGTFRTVEDVVALTGTSRRTVEAVFRALEPHLESSGDGRRIAQRHVPEYDGVFGDAEPAEIADPWTERARRAPAALAAMDALIAAAPPPVQALDHVPATAETVLKRARFMLDGFDLRGAHVLCVGDHDLTSLGLFVAGGAAGLRVSVADIDERLLEFIDAEAARRGWDVRCHAADLRLGLPAALRDSCQLVFTDPPYTPDGVALFVARGLQGLQDHRNGRVLLAYGYGEQQPALGLAVQKALNPLHLAYEAMLPGFNRYVGAQAIGSTAALYVLRPTKRTAAAARATADDPRTAMYTHGAQSVEAGAGALDEAAVQRILELAPGEGPLLVGDGWPAKTTGRRVPLRDFLAAPLPRNLQGHGTVLINLYPGFGASAARALLAANAPRAVLVCRNDEPFLRDAEGQRGFRQLVAPGYRVERLLRGTPSPGTALVLAERNDEPAGAAERVLAYLYARAHGKIGNGWREGLIALRKAEGSTLTKAEARRLIETAADRPDLLERSLIDLPAHLLGVLARDVRRSVGALPD